MCNYSKIFTGLFLFCFFSTSYAIDVNVQATSSDVSGLGFTVNGKNHGGKGNSYTAKNMPSGIYTFGIRVNGAIFGKDISCYTGNGGNRINLNKDTNATLMYDGKNCKLKIS
jgi:hypothetical protein